MKIKDKVLIVEDEQSISNFISMILTANGYDTIIGERGVGLSGGQKQRQIRDTDKHHTPSRSKGGVYSSRALLFSCM